MTTTVPGLEMTRVTMPQLPEVLTVLNEAAARLHARGIEQWPQTFEQDGGKRVDVLRRRIQRGEVHLLRYAPSGDVLGTISMSWIADPDFAHGWPSDPHDGLYVYRMAAADRARGLRVGVQMLALASIKALSHGRPFLRLDCSKTNTGLHEYYESCGFERVATVDVPGRKSGALFQRVVA